MALNNSFNFKISSRKQQILVVYILILFAVVTSQSEGDSCTTQSGKSGICVLQSQCDNLRELMRTNEQPVTCGFGVYEEVICCPRKKPEREPQQREQDRVPQGAFIIPLINMLESTSPTTTINTQEILKEEKTEVNDRAQFIDLAELFKKVVEPGHLEANSKSNIGNIGSLVTTNPFLPQIDDSRPLPIRNPWLRPQTQVEFSEGNEKPFNTINNNFLETNNQNTFGKGGPKQADDSIIFPSDSNDFLWKSTTKSPVITRSKERASVEACHEIDKGLTPGLTPHIIGGINVPLGEYPHMAALGFPVIGSEDYDFRCGGSLIAPRFVVTAAHCVIRQDSSPTIVRLGFVSLTDEQQLRDAVDINIERIHIHPNYTNSRSYHDIAILELERNVAYSSNIYPTCLYTEPDDPPSDSILYVTGWGVISTATRHVSNVLLKARLRIRSVEQCNASYVDQGNRQLPHGLDSTHMCAYDPGGKSDACQGDSGGPLNLVLDESLLKYRLVGITSAGFSCATLTPSLYTRVSSYLDFIESIVWPKTNPS